MPEVEKISISGTPIDIVDKKVVQTPTTTDADYEILFSKSANNTEETDGVRKYSGAIVNPSKNAFTFGSRLSNSTVGNYSFAEGENVTASGVGCHAEGLQTISSGYDCHAEGEYTTSSGLGTHAEGFETLAHGSFTHAEGHGTTANGSYSHSEGNGTVANHKSQHVFGEFNVADDSSAIASNRGNYAEIVGNGTDDNARSNARTLDWSGNEVLAGKLTVGAAPTANMDVATKKYVDDATINLDTLLGTTYATVDKGGFFRIGKLVVIDAVITALSNATNGQQLVGGIPATSINNMPLYGMEVTVTNTPTYFRVYTSGIYSNGGLTSGKQYHIFGCYMSS